MSSDVQASEILIGALRKGMRFSHYHSLPSLLILFLVGSSTEYLNWKPPSHANLPAPARTPTVQALSRPPKHLPHFLAPSNPLMPTMRSTSIYAMLWMRSGRKIPLWIPSILLVTLGPKPESASWKSRKNEKRKRLVMPARLRGEAKPPLLPTTHPKPRTLASHLRFPPQQTLVVPP